MSRPAWMWTALGCHGALCSHGHIRRDTMQSADAAQYATERDGRRVLSKSVRPCLSRVSAAGPECHAPRAQQRARVPRAQAACLTRRTHGGSGRLTRRRAASMNWCMYISASAVRHMTCASTRATRHVPPATCHAAISPVGPMSIGPRPETRDPRPETRDPRPEARDPRPETRDLGRDRCVTTGPCRPDEACPMLAR